MGPEAQALQPTAIEMGLIGVGIVLSIVALVCSVMVCVKMFQNNQTPLGIISLVLMFCSGIGYFITLIYGWMKSSEWNMKGLMMAYTVSFVLGAVLAFAGYGMMIVRAVKSDPAVQQQLEQMRNPQQLEPAQ